MKDLIMRHKVVSAVAGLAAVAGVIATARGGWGALLLAALAVVAYVLARQSYRQWSSAVLAAIALLSAINIVYAATVPNDNYCLLNVDDNQYGGSGVLAVPQANASQSVCDSVATSTQVSFDQGTGGNGAMFVITSDKPGFVTAYQQANMMQFNYSSLPGWLVYSGTVGGVRAGSDGSVSG